MSVIHWRRRPRIRFPVSLGLTNRGLLQSRILSTKEELDDGKSKVTFSPKRSLGPWLRGMAMERIHHFPHVLEKLSGLHFLDVIPYRKGFLELKVLPEILHERRAWVAGLWMPRRSVVVLSLGQVGSNRR